MSKKQPNATSPHASGSDTDPDMQPQVVSPEDGDRVDGDAPQRGAEAVDTERSHQRREEDRRFVPVIVKRTDEARRHADDVLELTIEAGLEQIRRPPLSLMLSAVAAGLIVGVSAMAIAVVYASLGPDAPPLLVRLAVAAVYPLGFILCILSGVELFTEHTATAVYPVLDRRASATSLLRLWGVVWFGNQIGAIAIAALLAAADGVVAAEPGYAYAASHLVAATIPAMLASSILAGWLMALGAWLVAATPPSTSQIICIFLVTFLIGIGQLHHSIAGSAEVYAALWLNTGLRWGEAARFVVIATIGNLLGGSLFVAALNYGHIRKSRGDRH